MHSHWIQEEWLTGGTVDLEHHMHGANRLPLAWVQMHVFGFDADFDEVVQEALM